MNYWIARISHEGKARQAKTAPGKRTRIYTMLKARAVDHPGIYAEIRHCIPTQTFNQIVQQPLMLQASPMYPTRLTVASDESFSGFYL